MDEYIRVNKQELIDLLMGINQMTEECYKNEVKQQIKTFLITQDLEQGLATSVTGLINHVLAFKDNNIEPFKLEIQIEKGNELNLVIKNEVNKATLVSLTNASQNKLELLDVLKGILTHYLP